MLRAFNEEFLAALGERADRAAVDTAHGHAVALMRELGATRLEQRLFVHPILFEQAELEELGRAAGALLRAQVKILEHLRATRPDAEILDLFGIPRRLLPFVRWDHLRRPEETVARLDLIPTRTGYACCALEVFPGVSGGEAHRCGELYLRNLAYPTAGLPPCPLRTLASLYTAQVRRRDLARVVILDSVAHGRLGDPRQELLARYLREATPGLTVELLDEERYPAAWLTRAEGERTLIHRMFTHEEVPDDLTFLDRLWQSGAAIAGFESELRTSKRFLALLCDPSHRALLDPGELAAIDQLLPHAFALDEDHLAAAAETLPLMIPEEPEPVEHRIVLGLYSYGGIPNGMLLRGSRASPALDGSGPGERIGWAFAVSEDLRRHLVRHARDRGLAARDQPPKQLVDFMCKDWAPAAPAPVDPYVHAAATRARRARVSQQYPGEVVVVPCGTLKIRSNDEHYPFRAASDFLYLTGHPDPDSVLVLVPEAGGHRAVLFVDGNPGKTDSTFFTDRLKGELWEGPRPGVAACAARYQIEDARALGELRAFVQDVIRPAPKVRILRGHDGGLEAWIGRDAEPQRLLDRELGVFLSELRLIKDDGEIAELRAAVDLTRRAFEDVIRALPSATSERDLELAFHARARREGNGPGYQPILAAGPHACVLHWRRNDGPVRAGELLLVDAGVENRAFYTADITRVLPVSGRFSPEQREIYDLVLDARRAALAEVAPGAAFLAPYRAAMTVLAHGLERLGILSVPAEEALRPELQLHRRYSLHFISHMLGLDVHDCAKARGELYRHGPLAAGMVLTIEPGLYFQPDDLTVPARYRGIGVRIEDDVLVSPTGYTNLSAAIPTAAADVEQWMADIWARP